MAAREHFSEDYAEAQVRFLGLAEAARGRVTRMVNPAEGPDGVELSTDSACFGPTDASQVLVAVSGTHGAEGFAGSAIQCVWLDAGLQRSLPDGLGVVLVHALNPFGFAWLRRVNENNVDLNRNFIDHEEPHPHNARYQRHKHMLVPPALRGNARERADEEFIALATRDGRELLRACGGQYDDPKGLFYGGRAPAWSHRALRELLPKVAPSARRVAYVDLHTGLGPYGYGDAMSYHPGDTIEHALAKQWWGDTVSTARATSDAEGVNSGKSGEGAMLALPQADVVAITLEFGTRPLETVIGAIRDEYAVWRYGASELETREVKERFLDAFYPQADDWREMVVERGLEVLTKAVQGLSD